MRPSSLRLFAIGGREWALLSAVILASIVFSVASPYFATAGNAATIVRNSTELMLAGLGMTLLLAMGSIDVSIGILMGLAAIAVSHALLASVAPALALLVGPVTGAGLGMVTALVVVLGRVPAIVGTLGLLGVYRMGVFVLLGGQWLSGLPAGLTELLSRAFFGIPLSVFVIGLAYLAVWLALRRTAYGPHLLSIGNAEEKARLSGVPVNKVRVATFVVSGVLTGLAASFYVANYRNVEMAIGSTLALDAIAAVVLGGTSILGGRCSLLGTALGVILLRVLQNGLLLVGVPSLWQPVVTGALLIGVLALEVPVSRLGEMKTKWMPR
ncbi:MULTISPECIES: ABC transporter permease [unclassified Shinella]|uniref:ABC transporter permease n=1 Tax=unclassified Shinella TaxID=2643062 RepID=UPI00234EF0F4|nr:MULTISPECIES: ABC transporter permease [unclassified Shinella]MCO5148972.1 ABC transporter permease [Shinella sp.]MDC7265029.1 ABC transporter permease [Shinella sp. HY16]MDC7271926.1 ABC transporter permease [Shinella sp. YZ44]